MYGIADFLWGAVLGERSAAWLFQVSDEQRRNAPQRKSALRVVPKCGSRVVALLAKAISIACVATPSGTPHLGTTIPYIKSKSALILRYYRITLHQGPQAHSLYCCLRYANPYVSQTTPLPSAAFSSPRNRGDCCRGAAYENPN